MNFLPAKVDVNGLEFRRQIDAKRARFTGKINTQADKQTDIIIMYKHTKLIIIIIDITSSCLMCRMRD